MVKSRYEKFLKNIKYIFPVCISVNKALGFRKRWLHKGYQLYNNTVIGQHTINEHIVYFDTLKQANIYLKNEYNITLD